MATMAMNLLLPAFVASLACLPFLSPQDPVKPDAPVAAAATKVAPEQLKKLEWISGTWVMESGGKTIEEHWRPLQGTTMLGTSHTFDDKKTHFFEFLRITAMRGQIAYLASPGGGAGTAFMLSKLEDGVVEFENAKHDHPQRIRYEQTKEGLTATISQLDGTKSQAFVFKKK